MSTISTLANSNTSLISPSLEPCLLAEGAPLKLGILASGSGSNFEAIAEAIAHRQLNAQVQVVIYNNPDAKVGARAQKFGVPAILLNHRDYTSREELDAVIVKTFQEYNVEWVIMAGWMRIVTPVLLDAFPQKVINIHPSLLPSFPGIRAVEQALKAGVKITGCTVHIACLKVDSGPILMQAAVPVLVDDTPETLHARIQVQEHKTLVGALALLAARRAENLE
ncbi:phosphoribosylglycinamide formyltransferase [Kamptonema animale CS-326]|jgi:phosphoribosylglycinamide formyltransferase-1|uniref:phosphoribosylglycinamide formyltransferase n=1 Tax=Kamptonema animale TaxID=92934 RepID=UPI0023310DB1|nr:phosphoribosylglycinamide formyltransferase [Kamptonema animale]MDB9511176.1 phosphoribosylglycinamide formyltransferase [Kamptonema animale CS-326]